MIKIEMKSNPELFRAVKHVSNALCKSKDHRLHLKHIKITEKHLVGTDGSCLHYAQFETNLEPGFYRIEKSTKTIMIIEKIEEEINYPDYRDLIGVYIDSESIYMPEYSDDSAELSRNFCKIILESHRAYNYQFYVNAVEQMREHIVYYKKEGGYLVIKDEILTSVIMSQVSFGENEFIKQEKK